MNILRVKFDNIGLFKRGFCIDLTAVDRVSDKLQVTQIMKTIYAQKVIGIVGINASGKSTALKLIKIVMDLLLGHKGLDQLEIPKYMLKDNSTIEIDFFHKNTFYRISSVLGERVGLQNDDGKELYFKNETIYGKNASEVKNKKTLFEYYDENIIFTRKQFEEQELSTLKPVDSIVIAITKEEKVYYTDMIQETNINLYKVRGTAQTDFINLFDESIKSLNYNDDNLEICFKANDEEYNCDNAMLGHEFLSSGTIKGGNLIYKADLALKRGGYLLVDEIEIHMHKELVLTIIEFFNDPEVNKNGATLIFTTHYAEILDSMERKDNIYITTKKEDYSCAIIRFSDEIKRNDIKKSDIFLSNYIDGTAPSYESIERVRKLLCQN